jgi:hypothetical protein
MRRVFLAGSFIALMAALVLLWNHRYEQVPGMPVWRLADLREDLPGVPGVQWMGEAGQPELRLKVDAKALAVSMRLVFPGMPAVEMLHIRHRMVAHDLIRGPQKWQTGRLVMEWHSPDGSTAPEMETVGGIEFNQDSGFIDYVTLPEEGSAIPSLRLEHLGLSGEWKLTDLEIIPVRERFSWRIGSWVLVFCWVAWFFACVRSWPGINRGRALLGASLWLLMGVNFVVPGPWKTQRPVAGYFDLGKIVAIPPPAKVPSKEFAQAESAIISKETAPLNNIPARGSLVLRIKVLIAWARPFLHSLLLCAPVLVSAWLIGRRPTLLLAVLLSLAIEAAQTAFGYGFDWIDITDLATDAAGILLGLWLCRRFPLGPFRKWAHGTLEAQRPA